MSAPPARVRIRAASGKDVRAASELLERYWAAAQEREVRVLAIEELRWLSRATRQGGGLEVLVVDGVVRGLVGWRRGLEDPSRGLVLALCVEPGAWQAGAFEALLEAATRGLSRAGCGAVDVWLEAEASPARLAAEALGFASSEERRPLGVLGTGPDARQVQALRFSRPLEPLPVVAEVFRLALPRFFLTLVLVVPLVLLMLSEAKDLLPLTGLALPLGVFAPSAAEVWARRRRRPGAIYGLLCTLLGAGLGIAWVLHVSALDGGGPASLLASRNLFEPLLWILGAHWAPIALTAGVLSARSLQATDQRAEAFLDGTALLLLSLFLGLLPVSPVSDGLGLLFGVICCSIPSCWGLGAVWAFVFWLADDLYEGRGQALELHFAEEANPDPA